MKPLIVLLVATLITGIAFKSIHGTYEISLYARIGMSVMLLFTALGHFMFTEGMAMMIPNFIPYKKEIVYITAVIEVFGAIGLHIPQYRTLTTYLLILFFILIIPANIKAAIEHIEYQKATFNGHGLYYLWFRIPLQIFYISWVYLSSIKYG
ncbi:hypothetical protein [Maribacter sp. MAR_2009_72]|uniref:DoxX family protein n=1 Tax=Maribacter sp. MAR_2009_72 TaxID=1250050 RepID=UPI00119916E1|nr:hypothetical protein [Maribacter sp. MAR_2009_72]TVZ15643.1 putative membrane protein [Maribacter sp. MAR_2009_72]